MDSELFEGINEQQKAEFIGNFFHFVKCRFSDCNLLQTKSKLNTHVKSESPSLNNMAQTNSTANVTLKTNTSKNVTSPTGAESKAIEDKKNVDNWASGKGNGTPAYNEKNVQLAQTKSKSNATSNSTADRKAKMVTNSFPQVEKALAAEKAQLLITPDQSADNKKDSEPTNVQLKAEIKKWKTSRLIHDKKLTL